MMGIKSVRTPAPGPYGVTGLAYRCSCKFKTGDPALFEEHLRTSGAGHFAPQGRLSKEDVRAVHGVLVKLWRSLVERGVLTEEDARRYMSPEARPADFNHNVEEHRRAVLFLASDISDALDRRGPRQE